MATAEGKPQTVSLNDLLRAKTSLESVSALHYWCRLLESVGFRSTEFISRAAHWGARKVFGEYCRSLWAEKRGWRPRIDATGHFNRLCPRKNLPNWPCYSWHWYRILCWTSTCTFLACLSSFKCRLWMMPLSITRERLNLFKNRSAILWGWPRRRRASTFTWCKPCKKPNSNKYSEIWMFYWLKSVVKL